MRYGDSTYLEISKGASRGWLAVVPTGCTEQQGPHLPVDHDTWLVEQVTLAASMKAEHDYGVHSLVLPVMPFGPTPEHRNFGSGYIHIPQELHERLLESVLVSLAEQGFRRIIVWRGCGQHDFTNIVEVFNKAYIGQARVFLPELPYADIMHSLAPGIPGGHADSFSTSLSMHLRPQSVRTKQIPQAENQAVDWKDPNLDFARCSSTGIIGDASQATPDLGAKLWKKVIASAALTFKKIASE